jgi:DNA polymerase I
MLRSLPFHNIVAADFEFEFGGHNGNRPRPVCAVMRELRTGQTWRITRGNFGAAPPFSTGPETLFIAYYSSAELGCFKALNWKMPERVLDLFVEFRCLTNGTRVPGETDSLIGALDHFGLDLIGTHYKKDMVARILQGPPYSNSEMVEIVNYCEGDVAALGRLLSVMLSLIDLPRALLRGRYMAAAASIEHFGVPIDVPLFESLKAHRESIKRNLIIAGDAAYGVFADGVFKQSRFETYLARAGIPWARLPSGALDLEDDTFEQAALTYPAIAPLWQLRRTLSGLRLNDLQVGSDDGRNRCLLSAFRSKTGRNQPSNTKFIFGPAVWIRGLIKPPPGFGIAYIDWASQEIGIASALSNDAKMMAAYNAGDVYLAFGKQAGRLPPDATKESHTETREILKTIVLGVGYGMESKTMAARIGQPEIVARELLRAHKNTYCKFWKWSDAAVDTAMQGQPLRTVFGWTLRIGDNPNPRSLRNFVVQASGAEMLRLACCLGIERGIEIVAPVHDAVMICAPLDRLDEDIATMRAAMAEASRGVLSGFELRTDVSITRYPDRYADKRGSKDWETVMRLLAEAEREKGAA